MKKRKMYSGKFESDAVLLTLKNKRTVKETDYCTPKKYLQRYYGGLNK